MAVTMTAWYSWNSEEEFDRKCANADWRYRMHDYLWDYYTNDFDYARTKDLRVTAIHLEKLGFNADKVDEYAYLAAVQTFIRNHLIPDSKIRLSPKEESLFRWGVEMGLPLLAEGR